MKRNNDYHYSEITSFEDLRLQRTRLKLRGKLIQTKIKIDFIQTREALPLPALVLTVARKFIPQNVYEILEGIINK